MDQQWLEEYFGSKIEQTNSLLDGSGGCLSTARDILLEESVVTVPKASQGRERVSSRSRVKAGIARLRHQAMAGRQAAGGAPLANGVHDCRPESREAGDRKAGEIEMRVVLDAALLADAGKWLTAQAARKPPPPKTCEAHTDRD
ncbi:hypothetical protein TrVGV298_009078 [Trichoderma virens]|nr:hypothetical protein TrVGV298_009078 [Trichoderma virens]